MFFAARASGVGDQTSKKSTFSQKLTDEGPSSKCRCGAHRPSEKRNLTQGEHPDGKLRG